MKNKRPSTFNSNKLFLLLTIGYSLFILTPCHAQTFAKTVLTTGLSYPWEIVYGPDNMLWITQTNGRISRIDPVTGAVSTIYQAPDYFVGTSQQNVELNCNTFSVAAATYGLALHPNFLNEPYLYFIYSYNAGTTESERSQFKIRRLRWNVIQTPLPIRLTSFQICLWLFLMTECA